MMYEWTASVSTELLLIIKRVLSTKFPEWGPKKLGNVTRLRERPSGDAARIRDSQEVGAIYTEGRECAGAQSVRDIGSGIRSRE